MYCKLIKLPFLYPYDKVLIVAKCIVNILHEGKDWEEIKVLIVAKCIVNSRMNNGGGYFQPVLIVAKCIVNEDVDFEDILMRLY